MISNVSEEEAEADFVDHDQTMQDDSRSETGQFEHAIREEERAQARAVLDAAEQLCKESAMEQVPACLVMIMHLRLTLSSFSRRYDLKKRIKRCAGKLHYSTTS